MTETMVERVARAIKFAHTRNLLGVAAITPAEKMPLGKSDIGLARAAIEAMRFPTTRMVDAGREWIDFRDLVTEAYARVQMEEAWNRAISAALSAPPLPSGGGLKGSAPAEPRLGSTNSANTERDGTP